MDFKKLKELGTQLIKLAEDKIKEEEKQVLSTALSTLLREKLLVKGINGTIHTLRSRFDGRYKYDTDPLEMRKDTISRLKELHPLLEKHVNGGDSTLHFETSDGTRIHIHKRTHKHKEIYSFQMMFKSIDAALELYKLGFLEIDWASFIKKEVSTIKNMSNNIIKYQEQIRKETNVINTFNDLIYKIRDYTTAKDRGEVEFNLGGVGSEFTYQVSEFMLNKFGPCDHSRWHASADLDYKLFIKLDIFDQIKEEFLRLFPALSNQLPKK